MMKYVVHTFFLCFLISSCGVKGPPRPPLRPVQLGRGRPDFKGATKDMAYKNLPPVTLEKKPKDSEENQKKKQKEK